MKKKIIYIAFALISLMSSGCSDFLDAYSQDMVVAKSVSDLDEVLIGSVYMKSFEVRYGISSETCGFFNILDDDVNTTATSYTGSGGSLSYVYIVNQMFGYFTWQQDVRYNYGRTNHVQDGATWSDLYYRINVANIILDEIEEVPHATEQEQKDYLRVKGETHFLRAQFYFVLANLYGDAYSPSTCATKLCVPLKLTPYVEYDKDKETQFHRNTVKEVYDQIVKDLLAAEKYLTESPQSEKFRLHRATAEAVDLLLSRVYLYMQDWANAEKAAKKVMDSQNFMLATLAQVRNSSPFLTRNNKEVIFSQGPNNIASQGSDDFCFYAVPSDYCVTMELYNSFQEEDARKASFFAMGTDSVRLMKYERGLTQSHISDVFLLRMSEAYLNHMEACAMQSDKEAQANTELNQFRTQRIENYSNETYRGEELVNQIRNERRKELCFEAKRWFDLRRYAVCEKYPYSREIVHAFNEYNDNLVFVATLYYKLLKNDLAYTFGIPRPVLEADKVPMVDNPRDERKQIKG